MPFHKNLKKSWNTFSIHLQMANIGAEVGRAVKWKEKGKTEISLNALYRALELIDFTIADPKNKQSLSEITRLREVLNDHIVGDNIYKSTAQNWDKYFYYFTVAARRGH